MATLAAMATALEELVQHLEGMKTQLGEKNEEIKALKEENSGLKKRLSKQSGMLQVAVDHEVPLEAMAEDTELVKADIERYSRQLILPELRVAGQKKLKGSSALIVGCGGLGCPAAAYLSAAGVGRVGLVDHDTVELSNLHRQVLHTQARIGTGKAVSLAISLAALNPSVDIVPYKLALTSSTALAIIKQYDIVLDCTDNVATRYLLSDACLLAAKPLVSGSALRWEGQLTTYNHEGGPTYRCIHPTPPPADTVTNCSEGGVMGAVPGVIGSLQALETIKILSGVGPSYSGSLLVFDGSEGKAKVVKLRKRKKEAEEEVTELIDYEQFCGAAATDKDGEVTLLPPEERITVQQLSAIKGSEEPHLVVDVRPEVEVEMCGLPSCLNLPLAQLQDGKEEEVKELLESAQEMRETPGNNKVPLYLICRRGNDSQVAVSRVRELLPEVEVKDVMGGLQAWSRNIDPTLPIY